jgi:hypothetical protein
LRNVVLARVFQVDNCRLGAGFAYVAGVVAVADDRDNLVAALGQDLGQASGNLPVASGNGYSHGFNLNPVWSLVAIGVAGVIKPAAT